MLNTFCFKVVLWTARVNCIQTVFPREPNKQAQQKSCKRENLQLKEDEKGDLVWIREFVRDAAALNSYFGGLSDCDQIE